MSGQFHDTLHDIRTKWTVWEVWEACMVLDAMDSARSLAEANAKPF